MISRIYIIMLALFIAGGSLPVIAAEENETPNIIVECKDVRIRVDAVRFFEENLKVDSTKRDISNLIKRFYFQWPIKDIRMENDGRTFRFSIELKSAVTEFDIDGNDNIKSADLVKELREAQMLYQGDDVITALRERTKTYYAYRGFYDAEVEVKSFPRKESGTVKILVKVKENKPCLIDDVLLEGDSSEYWTKRVKQEFQWHKKMRCDQEKIQNQITKLRERYNEDHYYQFDMRNPTLVYADDIKTTAKLKAELIVGSRIVIEFEGNRYAFERNELMKRVIFLDQEKKFNPGFENAAIQAIKDFYSGRGYPLAEVKLRQDKDVGIRRLTFEIDRGPVIRLRSIKFEGNREISKEKLTRQFWALAPVWTKKRLWASSEIPEIINGLLAYYQSMGYLHVSFYEPSVDIHKEKHEAKLSLKLQEGAPSYFEEFHIRNNVFMSTPAAEKFFDVKKGDPIDPIVMRDSAQKLEYEYQTNGFKYAKVKLPSVDDIAEGYNQYSVNIDEGQRIRIGDIAIQGNYSTHAYVITRELTIKSGDLLNPDEINESRRRLLRLGFFQSVSVTEKVRDDLKDVEDIVITVIEQKKHSVVIRPGVSKDDGARLGGSFGYTNIAGTGRSAILSGRVNHQFDSDAILEDRIVLTYLEPQIFNFANGKINLIQDRSDEKQFDITKYSVIFGLEKYIFAWLRTTLQYELEFRNPFNVDTSVALSPLDESRARFGSMGAIIDFDFRDNLLNPNHGSFHRIQFNFYDRLLWSDADFYELLVRNSFYIPIYHRVRSVLSVRGGYAATRGQTKRAGITEVPIEKRFRLGGNSSLRGFGRNCVGGILSPNPENCSDAVTQQAPGGNSMFNYLFDLLLPLTSSWDFVLFTDGGNAFLNDNDFSLLRMRTTAGFGLRYNTIVGPLRVDYGIKLDRRTGESFGEFHFAVGQF